MLPLEAINRIRVLSERGMGSKAIAKSMGISRNTVRKYLSHFQTLTPISSEVQRPSRLFPGSDPRVVPCLQGTLSGCKAQDSE